MIKRSYWLVSSVSAIVASVLKVILPSVTIPPTCVWPLGSYLLSSLCHLQTNHMFNVFFFQWTGNRVLWCLLLFTVHRTLISWVFLPHAFVDDYSTSVDFFFLIFFCFCCPLSGLSLWVLCTFFFFFNVLSCCFVHFVHFPLSVTHCKADILHYRWGFRLTVFSGRYMTLFSGFRVFVGG